MGLHYSTKELSRISKHKKAVICLMEKICVLDKLYSDRVTELMVISNVDESTICIKQNVFKDRHLKQGYVLIS